MSLRVALARCWGTTWSKAVPPGGAAIYTGTRIPEWRGSLIVGSLGVIGWAGGELS